MSADSYSLEHVDEMIDFLDKQIAAGRDTPAMLSTLQQRLDIIDMTYRGDPKSKKFYSHMLELQSLIYGRREQDEKAMQFMKEAVRQAGGVGHVYSQTIRQYIAAHSQVPTTPQRHRRRRLGKFGTLLRFRSRGQKVALAATAGLLLIMVTSVHFVPQVSAFSSIIANHSQIVAAKKSYETLSSEYTQCSSQLNQERNSINTSDNTAVDNFNTAMQQCQALQKELNQAVSRYNSLVGSH